MTLEEVKDYLYATLKVLTKNTDEEIRAYIEMLETESPKMTIAELEKEIAKLKECGTPLEEIKQMEEPCDDVISRQAAIDIVEDMHDLARSDVLSEAIKQLSELPSVTSQPNVDKIRAEIMDTGAYEQEVNGRTEFLEGINYCLNVIDKYKAESEDKE